MKKILPLFAAILLAVTFMPAFASAALYATNVTGQTYNYPSGGTVGTEFKVNSTPVTINQLGVFDYGSDGLAESHAVGIWNGDTLLASVTIPSDTAASLDKGFRWLPITPLTLSANTAYTLGAFYAGGADWFGSVATINTRFSLLSNRYLGGAPFDKPTDILGTVQGWYGPNMAFNSSVGPPPAHAPIPATIWLLGAGLVGMLGLHRRFYA